MALYAAVFVLVSTIGVAIVAAQKVYVNPHPDEHLTIGGRKGEVEHRRRLTETPDSERTHSDLQR